VRAREVRRWKSVLESLEVISQPASVLPPILEKGGGGDMSKGGDSGGYRPDGHEKTKETKQKRNCC